MLSAFLDALTVMAVVITVASGFYGVYHRVASGKHFHHDDHDSSADTSIHELHREDLVQFRAFLRSLVMHAAVGTALGGVTTLVGEPQNLLIATVAGWDFIDFFVRMAPVSLPVFAVGLVTCALLERFRWFGYGARLPEPVRHVLEDFDRAEAERAHAPRTRRAARAGARRGVSRGRARLSLGGRRLDRPRGDRACDRLLGRHGRAAARPRVPEALPFTALLVVFFAIVAVIHDQHLFQPIVDGVLALPRDAQAPMFFVANGLLSAISDNVFVATVYINEVAAGARQRRDRPRAFRRAGGRDQHGHQYPERRNAQRPSGLPVPPDLGARAADPALVHANGRDGVAVHGHDDFDRTPRRNVSLVGARTARRQRT